jgi:hypothetical protein
MTEHVLSVRFEVMQVVRGLKLGERERIVRWMERLIVDPNQEGDFEESDPKTGRKLKGTLLGRHALYWWVDGPVNEVKVVDIGPADRFNG